VKEKEIWQAALGQLEIILSKASFSTWFKNTSLILVEDGNFIISVPNAFTKEWFQKKYHKQICEVLENVTGEKVKKVEYQIGKFEEEPKKNKKENIVSVTLNKEEEKTSNSQLNPKYIFETFVVGDSNRLAHAACVAVAKSPGKIYNPLFIYGGVGLGKTHLLQAIGNEILKKSPKKRVVYVSCEKFVNEFIQAISSGKIESFKNNYRNIDVLLIDDIQFLAGKEGTQEEFFHTFNSLYQEDKQIVISSDRPPKAIPTLEERLRSRFEWGMIADIQPPNLETRTAILEQKCLQRGYNMPKEVIHYIAKNIQYNIRELEGALNRIIAYCELNGVEPSLNLASQVLESFISNPKDRTISEDKIIKVVASFFNISQAEIKSSKRNKDLVLPRQIIMYLLREEVGYSFPKIAQILGGKDHTTIMYGCEKIKKEIQKNENFRREVQLIKEKIYS